VPRTRVAGRASPRAAPRGRPAAGRSSRCCFPSGIPTTTAWSSTRSRRMSRMPGASSSRWRRPARSSIGRALRLIRPPRPAGPAASRSPCPRPA